MTEKTENEKKLTDDDCVSSFEEMFDSYGEGWTLSIYRETPKELAGFLEEFELEPGENPVNLQYLINTWGGKILRLMLRDNKGVFRRRMLLQLRSFPPRVNGKLCNAPEDIPQKDVKKEMLEYFALLKELRPDPIPQQTSPMEHIFPLIVPILKAMAEKSLNPPPPPIVQSQAASMADTIAALGALREFVQPPQESDMGTAMLSIAEKVLPLIAERKLSPQPPVVLPPIRPVSMPSSSPPMPSSSPPMPISSTPMPSSSPPMPSSSPPMPSSSTPMPSDEQMFEFLQNKLAEGKIGGKDLSKLYFDTLARLPDNEQREAEVYLENALGIEPIDDDDSPVIPTPIPRRTSQTDEGDDKNNRSSNKKSG